MTALHFKRLLVPFFSPWWCGAVLSDCSAFSPLTVTPSPDMQALKLQQVAEKTAPLSGESRLLRKAREQRDNVKKSKPLHVRVKESPLCLSYMKHQSHRNPQKSCKLFCLLYHSRQVMQEPLQCQKEYLLQPENLLPTTSHLPVLQVSWMRIQSRYQPAWAWSQRIQPMRHHKKSTLCSIWHLHHY